MSTIISPSSLPNSSGVVLDKIGLGLLLSGCATLFGAIYMFGFWRPFGFDVFPYASPIDYISAPLNRLSVLASTPLLLALLIFGHQRITEKIWAQWVGFYLIALCSLAFLNQQWRAASTFFAFDFHYENEKSVLAVSSLLFLAGIATAFRAYRHPIGVSTQVAALLLVLAANSMSAGYTDGKIIFNGADRVFLLENKDICDAKDVRDWMLVGKVGERTFFMNTIDKRLCLTAERNYRLVPRKYAERL